MTLRANFPAILIAAGLLVGHTAYTAEIYTEETPPAPRTERMPRAHDGLVWAPGHWEWSSKAFYWVAGSWMVERRGQHWVPASWDQTGSQWHFLPGHWDHQG